MQRAQGRKVEKSKSRKVETGTIRLHPFAVVGASFLLLASAGCSARQLNISQDPYVNNAMHHQRPPEHRTGEPLELTVVCVRPKDLERDENELLRPESGITSRGWYEKRPTGAGGEEGRFRIPADQIYLLTNDLAPHGRKIGNALRGAALDGEERIVRGQIRFSGGDLHSSRSVIYIFGGFKDDAGNVLPVRPAVFHPPGDYRHDLHVKVGVNQAQYQQGSAANWGQYIENRTRPGRAGGELQ